TPAAAPPAPVVAVPAGPQVGPPVTLVPAATARPYQLGTVSVGSVDRLLENGVRLVGTAFPLPMTAKDVRDKLLAEAGLAPEVAANLDLGSPAGAAIVALDEQGHSGLVLAIPARGPAEADRLIAGLGKPIMIRGPVTMIANAAGKSQGWVYKAGSVVVLGDEVEGMARGAMLALEARRAGADDVTAAIYPAAIAKAHGTDVKTAIAHFLEQMKEAQAAANPVVAGDNSLSETMGAMLGLIGDAEPIEIGLSVDPARGLLLRARLTPLPGSTLETVARDVRPFEIDPIVLPIVLPVAGKSDKGAGAARPAMIGGVSIGPFFRKMFDQIRVRLQADKGKGATQALAYYDTFLAALGNQSSGSVTVDKAAPYIGLVFSTPLKDAAAAAKANAALGKMDAAAMSALLRAQLAGTSAMFEWSAKRETVGKAKAMHFRMTVKKGSLLDTETVRRWLGGGFDAYQAVVGTRVVVTGGYDGKARLAAIASGKKAAPVVSASFTEAEAAAKGRDGFYYFDLAPLLGLAGSAGASPFLAAAARGAGGPIPLIATAGGDGAGKVWTADLTLPVTAFKSIAALFAAGAMAVPQ
ncbi:MAG TPA: hypothetical protein VHO06_11460, partial [Polyangia bacterium]|nr:hypothetical protein [Polyangia bacterium]